MKSSGEEKGEELDKEKYKMLIAEYRKFKTKNVKHFRFNSAKKSSEFGKSFNDISYIWCNLTMFIQICLRCTKKYNHGPTQERSYLLQLLSLWRSTLTRRPLTTSRETRRSRRRLSWVSLEAPWASLLGSPSLVALRSSSLSSGWFDSHSYENQNDFLRLVGSFTSNRASVDSSMKRKIETTWCEIFTFSSHNIFSKLKQNGCQLNKVF